MSQSTQPGFFTLGVSPDRYHLPHKRLGLPVILLIRRVLCRAFDLLREEDFKLAAAKEDEVTAALRSVIENNLRQTGSVRGFNRRTYEAVARQGEVANFDGTRRAKTPDLCFKLRSDDFEPCLVLSEFDALFVECKPVDAKHAAGGKYCDKGLIRFVNGDYAWAMQEGMMLAYVRDGRTIAGHLIPVMSDPARMTSLAINQLPNPSLVPDAAANSRAEAIYVSQHCRSFSWPDNKGQATDITIYHLWHDCG
ncbi:MAG: hypothetical protein IAG10_30910 [Planctomycetaceae bacterium]|nr:hypothetical protein [Planctomycetaceae bacterium]